MSACVFVCRECRDGGEALAEGARRALGERPGWRVLLSDCLSGCRSEASLAVRAPGKTAYLFGPVKPEDLPGLAAFAALYDASPDGAITDARPLGTLRLRALARIPPHPFDLDPQA